MDVDPEKPHLTEEEGEGDENPADIQPRFFCTSSVDLIPNAAVGAAVNAAAALRRRSSVRLERAGSLIRRKKSTASSPDSFKGSSQENIRLRSGAEPDELAERTADAEDMIRFGGPLTLEDLKEELRGLCTMATLRRKLPITVWLPKYTRTDLMGDLVAGLTVGLTVVPQCLAYAQIADIKLEYGLNSAYLGCFIYALLGTSKDVTVGPTAILSLLTGAFIQREKGHEGEWAILLCFFVGCFQLLMGFLRLGFLINFISTPVVSGFTHAAVIVIILSQVKNIMGVSFGSAKDNVVQTLAGYVSKVPATNGWDVLMGSLCITLLLLMREMRWPDWKAKNGRQIPPKWWPVIKEIIRLMNVSRYAIVVVGATAFQIVMEYFGQHYLSVTGKVDAKISAPKPPDFQIDGLSFGEILSTFGSGLVLVPLLATMESIAVAKTFAHKFRYDIDVTQEFLALGTANVVSSFFGAYPVTGAFTRSALAAESGVRTPMGCIVTGTFVVVAILSLGSLFQFIPKAALAAVIICACLTMFDFQIFKELWFIRKSELFVLILTMAMCLFLRVEFGLLIGLTVSILMLVYPMARPVVLVKKKHQPKSQVSPRLDDYKITIKPEGAIFFPAAEYLKEIFNDPLFKVPVTAFAEPRASLALNANVVPVSAGKDNEEMRQALPPIVFDGIHLTSSDYSTLRALRSVFVSCKSAHRDILFINTSDEILDIIMPFRRKIRKAAAAAAAAAAAPAAREAEPLNGGQQGARVTQIGQPPNGQ